MKDRGIYPEELANVFKGSKKKYRPSNGTEGDIFYEAYCADCKKDISSNCIILARTLAFDTDDKEYPEEWCYDDNGQPTCKAFEPKVSGEQDNKEREG